MKIVAFIFARGNSKGIKNKTFKNLKNNFTGSCYSASKKRIILKKCFFRQIAKNFKLRPKYKIKTPFLRPRKLSTDNSSEVDAWRHAIKYLREKLDLRPDYIVSIPTTCPLRKFQILIFV